MKWWNLFWVWYHNEMRHHSLKKRDMHLSRLRKHGKSRYEGRDYERVKSVMDKIML